MKTKRLTQTALLTAIALTIFMAEAQLPPVIPIPGVKLGLANIVTVFALFTLGPVDALAILLVRVLLGSMFAGQLMTLFYSLGGGLLAYCAALGLRHLVTKKQIWVCGAGAAVCHNIGQLGVAILVTNTPSMLLYAPVLLISGVLTGLFTGLCAQFVVDRLPGAGKGT